MFIELDFTPKIKIVNRQNAVTWYANHGGTEKDVFESLCLRVSVVQTFRLFVA